MHEEPYVNALGAVTGNQAMQMVRAGLKAIYLSGWQVAADANTAGRDVPRPEPLSGQRRAGALPPHQPHPAARRPDRARRGRRQARLVRADRRRRRGRLRRPAQQLRDHEGVHRGGRRGRPLRGPARLGEEVRPHGRQGADPDRRPHPQPRRRAPGRRRLRHLDPGRRPHRRRQRQAAHLATSTSATARSSSKAAARRRASIA